MRLALLISFLCLAAMAALSFYGFKEIPEGAMVARHWNLQGEADGFSPRNQALLFMPILGLFMTGLFALVPKIDPRPEHVKQSEALLTTAWIGTMVIVAAGHAHIVLTATRAGPTGSESAFPGFLLYAVSGLLIVIGNFTAKSRSNFFLGVRTPWTLSSEHAWSAANRTGGWMLVLTGVAAIMTGLWRGEPAGLKVLAAGAIAAAVVSIFVSYFAWRNDPDRRAA